jgi:hypothetical protein
MVASEKSVEEHWSKGKAWTAQVSKIMYVEVDYWGVKLRDKYSTGDRFSVVVPAEIPL